MSNNNDESRVSLNGLDPLEALRAMLAVDPDDEPVVEAADNAVTTPDDEEPPAD